MNQYQWTFLDNRRARHTLGIAHGPESGHLVVHCDHRVVLVEFSVLEPKEFSFFVEDELCRLRIDGTAAEGFTYSFHIDTEVDTEVNRARRVTRERDRRRTRWWAAAALALCVAFVGGISYWGVTAKAERLPVRLLADGIRAEAVVAPDGDFRFEAFGRRVDGPPLGADRERVEALPLRPRDSVAVLFNAADPADFIVDWRAALAPFRPDSDLRHSMSRALVLFLTDRLPDDSGGGACVLRALHLMGGRPAQLTVVDAYARRGDERARERWATWQTEPAYQNRLRQVCGE